MWLSSLLCTSTEGHEDSDSKALKYTLDVLYVVYFQKNDCILIHCGINKSVGIKIKMNTAH